MSENYCGKDCAACTYKEQLGCPGCAAGPGKRFRGTCDLAKCCQEKGHRTCETCQIISHCGVYRGRERIPENRIKRREAEQARLEALAQRAPGLYKWLSILFWLVIPSALAGILTTDVLVQAIPALQLPGQILSFLCNLAYGGILLRLSREEGRYGTAGVVFIISGALSLLTDMLLGGHRGWVLVISIVTAILSMWGEYNEFMGHAGTLADADGELSEKWEKLWKWNIGITLSMLVSTILAGLAPLLMLLVLLAASIGMMVVDILKLVYLYRTAGAFRAYME